MRLAVLFALCGLIIQSCAPKKSNQEAEVEPEPESNIRGLIAGDPNVQKAFEKAQEELPHFIGEFNRLSTDPDYMFYIKTKFNQDDKVEHMWSFVIEQGDNNVKSVLDNEPRDLTNVGLGDPLQVSFGEIEDLIILKGDSILVGNYLSQIMGE